MFKKNFIVILIGQHSLVVKMNMFELDYSEVFMEATSAEWAANLALRGDSIVAGFFSTNILATLILRRLYTKLLCVYTGL